MNKPLSYWQFFKGNVKKSMSLIISIAFSIILLGSIHLFIRNAVTSGAVIFEQYKKYTLLDFHKNEMEDSTYYDLINREDIERIIPVQAELVSFQGMAINSSAHVFLMDREDIIYLINLLDLSIDDKQLPLNDENKLILSENLMFNNDYKIHDQITGIEEYTIDSSFKSHYYIGFIPTSRNKLFDDLSNVDVNFINYGYLIIPKEGKLDTVNQQLKSFESKDVRLYDTNYWTELINGVTNDVQNLFYLITVIVLVSIGIGLGISTYVHYFQRRKEIAILYSLGYKNNFILLRINKEIILTTFFGFLFGVILLLFEIVLMNCLLLEKNGVPLYEMNSQLFSNVFVIPLFTSAFTLIPTWILLKKMDSVSILEGVK